MTGAPNDGGQESNAPTTDQQPAVPNPAQPATSPVLHLIFLAVIELLLFVASCYFANKLFDPAACIGKGQYFIILVFLAVCVSGFIFGLLQATAEVTGTYIGISYRLGGAAAFAFLIVAIGIANPAECTDFDVTVILDAGKPFLPGQLDHSRVNIVTDGDVTYPGLVDPEGHGHISGIPSYKRRLRARVTLESDGFSIANPPFDIAAADWNQSQRNPRITVPVLDTKIPANTSSEKIWNSVSVTGDTVAPNRPDSNLESDVEEGVRVKLMDGFTAFNQSSYSFAQKAVVPWSSVDGDIGATTNGPGHVMFFLPFDEPPYSDGKGSSAGIARAPIQSLDSARDCESRLEYEHFFYRPVVGTVYCVKSRYHSNFVKVRVVANSREGISFEWLGVR